MTDTMANGGDQFTAPTMKDGTDHGPRARVPWTTIALTIVEGLLFVGLLIPTMILGALDGIVIPLLVFLGLRVVGDGARWAGRDRPYALGIEGHAKAAAWGLLALMVLVALNGGPEAPEGPPQGWILAASLSLFGLSLYGHHRKALEVSPRLGIEEATTGATFAALGLPFALGRLIPAGPGRTIAIGAGLVVGLAVAASLFARLRRSVDRDGGVAKDGWSAFYHEHFFRHTLILVAVVAWFVLRDSLRGILPLFVLFEYGAGITLLGALFWSLRDFMRRRLVRHPLASPHGRHEQTVERHGEAGFDDLDTALGAYLDRGDTRPVAALAGFLESRGLAAEQALAPVTQDTRTETLLLVHPAWLYAARIGILGGIVLALWLFTDAVAGTAGESSSVWRDVLALAVLGSGLWVSQHNAFGGPWWSKTTIGAAGALFLILADARLAVFTGTGSFMATTFGTTIALIVLLVLLGVPAVHARSIGKPTQARYAGDTDEPLRTIARIRAETERNLVRRIVWLSIIGLFVFIGVAELERIIPGAAFLFEVYLAAASAVVLHPILLVAGLRVGRLHVARRDAQERNRRLRRYEQAMRRVEAALDHGRGHGATAAGPTGSSQPTPRAGPRPDHDPTPAPTA